MSAELPLKRSPPPPLPRKRLLKITPFPLSQTSLQLPRSAGSPDREALGRGAHSSHGLHPA